MHPVLEQHSFRSLRLVDIPTNFVLSKLRPNIELAFGFNILGYLFELNDTNNLLRKKYSTFCLSRNQFAINKLIFYKEGA